MKTEVLLVTKKDEVGKFVSVEDWIDTTIQVVSSSNEDKFSGTVSLEGTADTEPDKALWTPLLLTRNEAFLNLSGYSLAGIRATASGMSSGEVRVVATGR